MRSKGFFYILAGFVFEYFCDSRRILATFAKFCLNSLFATWSYRFTRHPARARSSSLHLPHKYFDVKGFYKILPSVPIVIAKSRLNASGISSRHALFVRRLGDLVSAKRNANRGRVCKVLCQKSMCGRWERERALDDVFRIKVTVRSCCKSFSIPNGKLLPNLSSSRLFLSAFHFHLPRKFPG